MMLRGLGFFVLILASAQAQPPEQRPSHRPIDSSLGQSQNPEGDLARRLAGTRAQRDRLEDLLRDKEIQKLAQRLLKDPSFLNSLKAQIPTEELGSLRERLQRGEGLGELAQDPNLQRLLREGLNNPSMEDKQRELLQKWVEKNPPSGLGPTPEPVEIRPPGSIGEPKTRPMVPGVPPTLPTPSGKTSDAAESLPAWMRERVRNWAKDLGKTASADPAAWRDFLKRLAENRQGGEKMITGTLQQASGLSKMLPRVGNIVPKGVVPTALPRFSVAVPRAVPSAEGLASGMQVLLILLVGAVLLLLIWRTGLWTRASSESEAKPWRLGPWPVAIHAIRTREQLVRAFEYLSLLLLGRDARTRHHRELAAQLATQPDAKPEERQRVAQELAELYAAARYAPPGERLEEGQLEQARRDLRRLAGDAA
jgi:hypothetical protein